MTVAAILLAGGESRRMGTPKPLLEWGPAPAPGTGRRTLIEYQIGELKEAGADPVIVVLGSRADRVRPYVHRAGARALINELYAQGRASSLRVGAAALSEDTQALLVLNVDQPRPREILSKLVDTHLREANTITVPTHRGRRGHPPVLAGRLLPELRQVREATLGLRALIQDHEADVRELSFDSPLVLLDLNRPQQYEEARTAYFAQVST